MDGERRDFGQLHDVDHVPTEERTHQNHLMEARNAAIGRISPGHPPYANPFDQRQLMAPSPNGSVVGNLLHPSSATIHRNSPSPFGGDSVGSTPSRSSPLPTLSELRKLQRANSAAGRLVAMKKLMGETPPSPTSLRRAGSLNVGVDRGAMMSRENKDGDGPTRFRGQASSSQDLVEELDVFGNGMLGSPTKRTGAGARMRANKRMGQTNLQQPASYDDDDEGPNVLSILPTPMEVNELEPPDRALVLPSDPPTTLTSKPRLGRSNTVGTGGGEERRSVIGRRMMERLGNRVLKRANVPASQEPQPMSGQGETQPLVPQRQDLIRESDVQTPTPEAQPHATTDDLEPVSRESGQAVNDAFHVPNLNSARPANDYQDLSTDTTPSREKANTPSRHPPSSFPASLISRDQDTDTSRSYSRENSISSDTTSHRRGSTTIVDTSESEDSHHHRPHRFHSPRLAFGHDHQMGHGTSPLALHSELHRSVSRASRMTARSGVSDTFEYESHLKRSGSDRRPQRNLHNVTPTPGGAPGGMVGDGTLEGLLLADSSDLKDDSLEEIRSPVDGTFPSLHYEPKPRKEEEALHSVATDLQHGHDDEHPEESRQSQADGTLARKSPVEDEADLLAPLATFGEHEEHDTPERQSSASEGKKGSLPSPSSIASGISAIPFFMSTGQGTGFGESTKPLVTARPGPRRDMSMSNFPTEVHGSDGRLSGMATPAGPATPDRLHRNTSTSMDSTVIGARGTISDLSSSPQGDHMATPKPAQRQIQDSHESPFKTHKRLGSAFQEPREENEAEENLDEIPTTGHLSIMS